MEKLGNQESGSTSSNTATASCTSRIAEVWLKQTNKRIDTAYDYIITPDMLNEAVPGTRVVVPFGNGSRLLEGFIAAVKPDSSYEKEKLREIVSVIDKDPVLTETQIALCGWLHRYYCSLYYEALALFTAPVPVVQKKKKNKDDTAIYLFEAYAPKRAQNTLLTEKPVFPEKPKEASYKNEEDAVLIQRFFQSDRPFFYECVSRIDRFRCYCSLAEQVMNEGGQTVILLPEIFSVYALEADFTAYFQDSGILYCGNLKRSARYRVFKGIQQGQISVVLGTRAALFLPYATLSLIIMDEPDDNAYFARSMPRYDTLRTAQEYCRYTRAKLFMGGSAAPFQITQGLLQQRIIGIKKENPAEPSIEIVDMQAEMRRGNMDFISGHLQQRMEETVRQGEKVLLMLNKRGAAGYMFCRQCGYVEKCGICGISMKPYIDGRLHCTYCGETRDISANCPSCGSHRFKPVGLGVEKAAEILRQRYPQWRILQIDAQNTDDEELLAETLNILDSGSWDVVIGTKALMKGWPFGKVSLTAVLLMDDALNHGDYNDSEKAYLLYHRFFSLSDKYAFGQTYEPEHEIFNALLRRDAGMFYEGEMHYRRMMHYPPMFHLIIFSVMDPSDLQAGRDADALFSVLSGFYPKIPGGQFFHVYQPVLAGIQPKTGRIRYKIMLKISQIGLFHQMTAAIIAAGEIEKLKSKVSIEIDPCETV